MLSAFRPSRWTLHSEVPSSALVTRGGVFAGGRRRARRDAAQRRCGKPARDAGQIVGPLVKLSATSGIGAAQGLGSELGDPAAGLVILGGAAGGLGELE